MPFHRIDQSDESILMPKKLIDEKIFEIYSDDETRVSPFSVVEIHTGIMFTGMKPNQYFQLNLNKVFAFHRPFVLANGIEVLNQTNEGEEITLVLRNMSERPALIDRYEKIADCRLLSYTNNPTPKKNKPIQEGE